MLELRDRVLSAEQRASTEAAVHVLRSISPGRPAGLAERGAAGQKTEAQGQVTAAAGPAAGFGQLVELQQLLLSTTVKLQAKDAQARKYKEGVRALKAKLAESEATLAQRQAQLSGMHTELAQLKAMVTTLPPHTPSNDLVDLRQQLADRCVAGFVVWMRVLRCIVCAVDVNCVLSNAAT